MASRTMFPPRSLGREYVHVAFSFAPNGTSAVDQDSIKGKGVTSVARTDVGDFTVTFDDVFADLVAAVGTVQTTGDTDLVVRPHTYSASAKTLTLTLLAGATATDLAADADNRVHLLCVFRNGAE